MVNRVLIGFIAVLDRSLMEEALLAHHSQLPSLSLPSFTLDLPGAGLIIRPINGVNMDFPFISLSPVGGRIDGSNFAVHGDLEHFVVPFSSFELVSNTGNAKGSMIGTQGEDVIQGVGNILMVILNNFSLTLLAFR